MVTGWKKAKIGELTDIVNGGTPSTAIAEYWNGGINWCTPSDITEKKTKYLSNTEKTITEKGLSESSASLLPIGTILLCSRATIGEMSIAASEMATNQGFKNLICKKEVDNEFLYYALFPLRNKMLELAIGTTFLEISKSALQSIEVIIPADIIEQTAIADALSDVDSLIFSLQKLIEKKKAIKQGAVQELLTGKKRLPGFYREWSKQQLGDICNIVNGGTPSTSIAKFWNGKILWCTPTDITSCSTKYIYTTESKITESGLKASSATLLPKGALLLCSRATIGEVRIAGNAICTNQGFKSLVVHQNISNEWLYYMVHILKFNMLEKAIGSTFLEISKKDLAELDIVVPEFTEQKAIAQVLSDMDSEIEQLEKNLAKYQQIKQGMMQELLTGRIRLVDVENNE